MTLEPIFKKFLADLIRWALNPPSKPGPFTIKVKGEIFLLQGAILKQNVTEIFLPELPTKNGVFNPEGVNVRRFRIDTTGDAPQAVFPEQDFPPTKTDAITVNLTHGVEVKLSLIDIDVAGNASPVDELVLTPSDVTAPSKPGSFTVEVTGEVDVPEA